MSRPGTRDLAWRFVIAIGVVSLFADFTYEGGRSIVGPYLGVLGATPLVVGVVAGVGEFLGYGLRLVSGGFVDRRGHHCCCDRSGHDRCAPDDGASHDGASHNGPGDGGRGQRWR